MRIKIPLLRIWRLGILSLVLAQVFVLLPTLRVSAMSNVIRLSPVSHLFWPFPNSSWSDANGWVLTSGSNTPTHAGSDYYAQDWALPRVNNVDVTCGQDFKTPIDGTVIWEGLSTFATEYGNQVVIQSSDNADYAFRVAHLQEISVGIVKGTIVRVGDLLGKIGDTGNSPNGCHAHNVYYKNINATFEKKETAVQRLLQGMYLGFDVSYKTFAEPFIFDATAPICTYSPTTTQALIISLNNASTSSTEKTICLTPSSTYNLIMIDNITKGANGLPIISTPVIILGNGATITRVSQDLFRIFYISPTGSLRLDKVTITNGSSDNNNLGGAILNEGNLNISQSIIESNITSMQASGGGVLNNGVFKSNSTVYMNNGATGQGSGGAISNEQNSIAISTNDVFHDNVAGNNGGAFYNRGDLTIAQGKVFNNSVNNHGGGIFSYEGVLKIYNSKLESNILHTQNPNFGRGGAIWNNDLSNLIILNTKISNNVATITGGGIYNLSTSIIVNKSCIQGNTSTSIVNDSGISANFQSNWWGSSTGPAPVGSGDSVSANVDYSNFLTSAPTSCSL